MKKLKIAIAGLGVVGKGVYDILTKDKEIIASKTDHEFEVVAVSSRSKKDFIDYSKVKSFENAADIAALDEVDVVIEVIGGQDVAKDLIFNSLKNGKKVITANKALIAECGADIAAILEENPDAYIAYEAAIAAAIPVVKTFKESYSSNKIEEFYGILNGTCNFISDEMESQGLSFADALKKAQELGYAEADPTFDVKGIDAAHKLTILSAIASGTFPNFKTTSIEGVDEVAIEDINLAKDLGYKIKLLGIYKDLDGKMQKTIYPALIKNDQLIANVNSSFNAILSKSNNANWGMLIGPGAGMLPTASAVVADLCDIACKRYSYVFGRNKSDNSSASVISLDDRVGQYFIVINLDKEAAQDKDKVQEIFADNINVQKASFLDNEDQILAGFLTDNILEKELKNILQNLDPKLVKSSKFLRVESIDSF